MRGSDGYLKAVWWSGTAWEWTDHGKPGPSVEVGAIGAVTGRDLAPGRPYGFVRGSDGHLWVRWWDGAWHWHDSGPPPGGSVENGAVSAVIVKSGTTELPHAFVRGSDGRLLEYVFTPPSVPSGEGSGEWRDRGAPPGRYVEVGSIGATTAKGADGVEYAHVFVRGSDGRLWLGRQQASGWSWADAGLPPGGAPDVGAISAISIKTGSTPAEQARVYVRGPGGHLWACAWTGTQCASSDHGTPPGRTVDAGAIAAMAARSTPTAAPQPRIFVRGSDGHLWVSWWNGTSAGPTVDVGAIGATIVKDDASATERPLAFVRTSEGHVQIRVLDSLAPLTRERGVSRAGCGRLATRPACRTIEQREGGALAAAGAPHRRVLKRSDGQGAAAERAIPTPQPVVAGSRAQRKGGCETQQAAVSRRPHGPLCR